MSRSWLIGVIAVALVGCSGTASSPAASVSVSTSSAPAVVATAPAATPAAAGSTLCGALTALRTAQDEHASPLATYIGDTLLASPTTASRATALSHATAIAATFLEWAPKINDLKSAELAPLIVATKKAYAGYGEGVTLLKPIVEGKGGDTLTALTTMKNGRDALDDALNQIQLLDASGSLDCPALA